MTMQMDVFGGNYALTLSLDERAALRRRIEPGQWGGAQTFAYRLQQRERSGRLTVTDEELQKAFVYAYAYGNGTWQKYFRAVLAAAKREGWAPSPELRAEVSRRRNEVKARRA